MASDGGLMNEPIRLSNGYNEAKVLKAKSDFDSETQLRHLPNAYVEACKQKLGEFRGLGGTVCSCLGFQKA